MNKQEFLLSLERALADLSTDERKDILRDIEEHFHEGTSRGQTDDDIIKKLGTPKSIADTIIAETKVKRISQANTIPSKIKAVFGALFAILLLTPFNFFFVLIPLLFVSLFFVIGWPLVVVLAISLPIIWIITVGLAIHVGFQFFALAAILFFALGWLGLVVAVIVGFSYLTYFYFRIIAKLFQWNIQFIKKHM